MDLREQEIRAAANLSGCAILDFPQPVLHETIITFLCSCEAIFKRVQWATRRDLKKQPNLRCRRCSYKYFTGERHPNYKPNGTHNKRPPEVFVWYREIARKFNQTCVISGEACKRGSAHHLYNYSQYPRIGVDLRNGVWLTRNLHEEFHNTYGRGSNTLSQFQEFYLSKTGNTFKDPFESSEISIQTGLTFNLVTSESVKQYCNSIGVEFVNLSYNPTQVQGNKHRVELKCSKCSSTWGANLYKFKMLKRDRTICHKCHRAKTVAEAKE